MRSKRRKTAPRLRKRKVCQFLQKDQDCFIDEKSPSGGSTPFEGKKRRKRRRGGLFLKVEVDSYRIGLVFSEQICIDESHHSKARSYDSFAKRCTNAQIAC